MLVVVHLAAKYLNSNKTSQMNWSIKILVLPPHKTVKLVRHHKDRFLTTNSSLVWAVSHNRTKTVSTPSPFHQQQCLQCLLAQILHFLSEWTLISLMKSLRTYSSSSRSTTWRRTTALIWRSKSLRCNSSWPIAIVNARSWGRVCRLFNSNTRNRRKPMKWAPPPTLLLSVRVLNS